MQTQTTFWWLPSGHFGKAIVAAAIGVLLLAALGAGVVFLTGDESASTTPSYMNPALEDPPYPPGWKDSYFNTGAEEMWVPADPPLPPDWVDPYFSRGADSERIFEDPPLPEGWVDPYFTGQVYGED